MLDKPNPFLIQGPATISFSGGRTSGYMLHQILTAHGGRLPDDVLVTFANTGKEREETLQFVHECETRWAVKVHWVEWRDTPSGFEEVDYNSASRQGEPFAALIAKKGMPPNWQARFCTQFLKVKAMTSFLKSKGFEPGYAEIIGLRDDEGMRVFKMLERNERDGRQCSAPLAKAHRTIRHVDAFWGEQPFDLELPKGDGNCDLCFLKGRGLRKDIIRRRPELASWWISQEVGVNGWFDRRDTYAGLVQEVARAPDLFHEPDDHDVECGLMCQPETGPRCFIVGHHGDCRCDTRAALERNAHS